MNQEPTTKTFPPMFSKNLEAQISRFKPDQIEAIVRLHCAQLGVLSRWQDAFTDRFGAHWVDSIGREVDLWAMSLELTGLLSEEQERRLREAALGRDGAPGTDPPI